MNNKIGMIIIIVLLFLVFISVIFQCIMKENINNIFNNIDKVEKSLEVELITVVDYENSSNISALITDYIITDENTIIHAELPKELITYVDKEHNLLISPKREIESISIEINNGMFNWLGVQKQPFTLDVSYKTTNNEDVVYVYSIPKLFATLPTKASKDYEEGI